MKANKELDFEIKQLIIYLNISQAVAFFRLSKKD